jgi:hypothetical protein
MTHLNHAFDFFLTWSLRSDEETNTAQCGRSDGQFHGTFPQFLETDWVSVQAPWSRREFQSFDGTFPQFLETD